MHAIVDECEELLLDFGFDVVALAMDGGSANRSLYASLATRCSSDNAWVPEEVKTRLEGLDAAKTSCGT